MPPAAIARSVWSATSVSPRRSRNSIADAGGNFGAPPKPPLARSCSPRSPSTAASRAAAFIGSADGFRRAPPRSRSAMRDPPSRISSVRSSHASATAPSTCRQLGRPFAARAGSRCRRRTGTCSGVRNTLSGQPPGAGHRLARLHVDGVDVGPLLAVELDRDEARVHQLRGLLVLERLALHHVAPVAGRVADREQDRPVLLACARERLLAPRVPVHGVVLVLEEVRRGLAGQPVGHRRSSEAYAGDPISPLVRRKPRTA